MKAKRLYTAPAMKIVAVETEQMIATSAEGVEYSSSKGNTIEFNSTATDEEGTAKRSTSLWDEDE